jgi:hypothetical protein
MRAIRMASAVSKSERRVRMMRYTVVLEQEEDGGYVASVPAFPDQEFVSEDDCAVCGRWPKRDRSALRDLIDRREPICDECVNAFFRNI